MLIENRPLKTTRTVGAGTVSYGSFAPLFKTRAFCQLGSKKQLGFADKVFSGATHTRKVHTIQAKKMTGRRLDRLLEYKFITKKKARNVEGYAILHDIDHGAYSHLTDPLVSIGHKERGILRMPELKEAIQACGLSYTACLNMMKGIDPLAQIVDHKPLGTEKIAYLGLDALYTDVQGMLEEGPFLDYVYYLEDTMVADIKIFNDVKLLCEFYRRMYAEVYYRKSVVLIERYLQSMIAVLLGLNGDEPEITEQQLFAMTDTILDYHLETSKNPRLVEARERLLVYDHPRAAVAFHVSPHDHTQWWGQRPVTLIEAPRSLFANKELRKPAVLDSLARNIEGSLGYPLGSVLLAPPIRPDRFEAPEIQFLVKDGMREMNEILPGHREQVNEEAWRQAALYVAIVPELREELGRNPQAAQVVCDLIMPYAQ